MKFYSSAGSFRWWVSSSLKICTTPLPVCGIPLVWPGGPATCRTRRPWHAKIPLWSVVFLSGVALAVVTRHYLSSTMWLLVVLAARASLKLYLRQIFVWKLTTNIAHDCRLGSVSTQMYGIEQIKKLSFELWKVRYTIAISCVHKKTFRKKKKFAATYETSACISNVITHRPILMYKIRTTLQEIKWENAVVKIKIKKTKYPLMPCWNLIY